MNLQAGSARKSVADGCFELRGAGAQARALFAWIHFEMGLFMLRVLQVADGEGGLFKCKTNCNMF